MPGRPSYLADSWARAYYAGSECGWGLFGQFYSYLSFISSFSLSLGDGPIYTEICLKGPFNRKQPTNQSLKRTSPEVKCLHSTSSLREMCTSSVSNVIYHKFSHGAAFYTLNGKNVNDMLECNII